MTPAERQSRGLRGVDPATQADRRWARRTLIVMLALISTWCVATGLIARKVEWRIAFVDGVLKGDIEAPYRYRVLKVWIGSTLEKLLARNIATPEGRHFAAYTLIALAVFFGLYLQFFAFLRRLFTERTALLGILLLQAVVPLTISGGVMVGDYINVLFFVIGLRLGLSRRDVFLPFVVVLGALNREQIVVLIVLYALLAFCQRRLGSASALAAIGASVAAFVLVQYLLRVRYGFVPMPERFATRVHVASNADVSNLVRVIVPLWLAEVGGLLILALVAFRRSSAFFRLGLLFLIPYTAAFFLRGMLNELGKFLPAYLILIPMALQTITGELASPARGTPPGAPRRS